MAEAVEWIIWIITGACNLHCPYCYASRYLQEKPLGFREVSRILSEASELGVKHVNYTGGEPLLRRDIVDIIRETIDRGMEASIFTNLTLANTEIIRSFSRLDVLVYTSLDGPREVYEKAKGEGTWARFVHGVKLLREQGVSFHVNIPVSRINYNRVYDAVRLAVDLGASSISIIPAMPAGRALATGTWVSRREFIEALKAAEKAAEELGITIAAWCSPFIPSLDWAKHISSSNCRDWKVVDLTPSGKLVLCDVLGLVVADVVKEGLRNAARKMEEHPLLKRARKIPGECMKCPLASFCRGGCYARALHAWGRLPSPDPLCPLAPPAPSGRL
ncbi:MAG: radical SAM protein [Hyperthermus sp.]|nr:MAG: radical SAM protein [Hyperthermus sp.]